MPLLQEYGKWVTIEGDSEALVSAFRSADSQWRTRLSADSVLSVRYNPSGASIRANGVFGHIAIGGRKIEIAPKFVPESELEEWRDAVFEILTFSRSTNFDLSGRTTGRAAGSSFIEVFARSFLDAVEPALDRQIPQEYEREQYQSENVEGTLLVDKLYPQVLTDPTSLWVEKSRLSSDTVLSRGLRYAAERFESMVKAPNVRKRLALVTERLSGVTHHPPTPEELSQYHLPPQHRPFEEAYDIASWLIHNQGAGVGGGQNLIDGVLLSSHRVYQQFVHRCLEYVARHHRGWRVDSEPAIKVAFGPKPITAYPDHVLRTGSGVVVLDSKYKGSTTFESADRASINRPKSEDLNQVAMAGRATGARDVGLIYPAKSPENPWVLSDVGLPERVHTLTINPIDFCHDRQEFFDALTSEIERLNPGVE